MTKASPRPLVGRAARLVFGLGVAAALVPLMVVAVVVVPALMSPGVEAAGPSDTPIPPAVFGSASLAIASTLLAFPLGFGAAMYLECAPLYPPGSDGIGGWLSAWVERSITAMASFPTVLFGLAAAGLLAHDLDTVPTSTVVVLTVAAVLVPFVVTSCRESFAAVPAPPRLAALALGGSPWTVVRHIVVPTASRSLVAVGLRSISRAFCCTAPLLMFGPHFGVHVLPLVVFRSPASPGPLLALLGVFAVFEASAVAVKGPRRE